MEGNQEVIWPWMHFQKNVIGFISHYLTIFKFYWKNYLEYLQ